MFKSHITFICETGENRPRLSHKGTLTDCGRMITSIIHLTASLQIQLVGLCKTWFFQSFLDPDHIRWLTQLRLKCARLSYIICVYCFLSCKEKNPITMLIYQHCICRRMGRITATINSKIIKANMLRFEANVSYLNLISSSSSFTTCHILSAKTVTKWNEFKKGEGQSAESIWNLTDAVIRFSVWNCEVC